MANTKRFILPLLFACFGLTLLLFSVTTGQSLAASGLNGASLYAGNNSAPQTLAVLPLIADFEAGAPTDWFRYDGGGSSVTAGFGSVNGNGAVSVTYSVAAGQWGGFGINYVASSGTVQDWSNFDGIAIDVNGQNSGATYTFEIQDKAQGTEVDRFTAFFTDDFTGTRKIILPFNSFTFGGYQEGTPPNDGFQTTAINAWAMPLPQAATTIIIEHMMLVNLEMVSDFESPLAEPPWFNYSGGGASFTDVLATLADSDSMALPGQVGNNGVLSVTANAGVGWAGFGTALTPIADWSAKDGITFWYHGSNLNTTHVVEVQTANAGDHKAEFDDNFTGWRQITLPFNTFLTVPSDLTQVDNWVFLLDGTVGSFKLDAMSTYGVPAVTTATVGFASNSYSVVEGGVASINVSLATTATQAVTVTVNSMDGTATAGSDYTAVLTQQVVIPVGGMTAVLTVATTADTDIELDETVMLSLTNTNGVAVGTGSAVLTITNDDAPDNSCAYVSVADFEGGLPADWFVYSFNGSSIVSSTVVLSDTSSMAVPGQVGNNEVLSLTTSLAGQWGGFGAVPSKADWSIMEGVTFWFYGTNSGETHEFEIQAVGSNIGDHKSSFTDDFTGWRRIVLLKDSFTGTPDLTQVTNWVLIADGLSGQIWMDDVSAYTCKDDAFKLYFPVIAK
ncbi:MAG: carbohydrate binding domain-containing protein [Candidatus Promineifilaceae bacterium]